MYLWYYFFVVSFVKFSGRQTTESKIGWSKTSIQSQSVYQIMQQLKVIQISDFGYGNLNCLSPNIHIVLTDPSLLKKGEEEASVAYYCWASSSSANYSHKWVQPFESPKFSFVPIPWLKLALSSLSTFLPPSQQSILILYGFPTTFWTVRSFLGTAQRGE